MFLTELKLTVSSDSIRQYKEIACKHLQEHNSTISVAFAGLDKGGNNIFGIRLISDSGEEWYDPEEGSHTLIGWSNKQDAYTELEGKVLPQMGYAVFRQDLQKFHKCMGELD